MTNYQVYKKTLSFSLVLFCIDVLSLVVVAGLAVVGFFALDKSTDKAIIGLIIGLIVGIIISVVIKIFITNRVKAGQIGMMAKGVTDDELPDAPFKAGLEEVKGRFGKLTAFFFVINAIKGVFRQIGRTFTRFGQAVGGDVGGGIMSAIDSAIQTVISYLADCCLGWVMYNKNTGTARAACEGAAIFFKHGKTLVRNIGRIFIISFISLVIIGGAFFGIAYGLFQLNPDLFAPLANEIAEAAARGDSSNPEWLTVPGNLALVIAAVIGLVMYGIIHSVFVRPSILVGVLRNFMAEGIKERPTEQDFAVLDGKSAKFAKLHSEA